MKQSNEGYLSLVEEAFEGGLRLPAFQRDWKWESSKVISLYDSLRKQFPIGSFLFLQNDEIDLGPRLFAGAAEPAKKGMVRLTLDGQQRITAGIMLLQGASGRTRFFLNLDVIARRAAEKSVDVKNDDLIATFIQELDDGDGYIQTSRNATDPTTMLLKHHLLSTAELASSKRLRRALVPYKARHFDRADLCDYLIAPHFAIPEGYLCPVTTLDNKETLAAVTRIFSTLNTTGKTLTPVEIVTAVLYAGDVDLKSEVVEYHEASEYLSHMDATGEILLQTIALLGGKSPKKALLPKTITVELFKAYYAEALSLLDRVGEKLSHRLGVGLQQTAKLLPYDAILAPMAAVHKRLIGMTPEAEEKALKKLDEWFVGAALSQRYQEGVHNKQEGDRRDFEAYIADDTARPGWLAETFVTPALLSARPNGALGRLVKCLMNRERQKDPLSDIAIGFYVGASTEPEYHHIYPTQFCAKHLAGWRETDSADLALNIMPLSTGTNALWHKMNPREQYQDCVRERGGEAEVMAAFGSVFVDEGCCAAMNAVNKDRDNFRDFLGARFEAVAAVLMRFGFAKVLTAEAANEAAEEDV